MNFGGITMLLKRKRTDLPNRVYSGSDCTGSNNAKGRTLTHTHILGDNHLVIVGRAVMMEGIDYTVSDCVVTFTEIEISNSDKIMLHC